MSWHTGALVIEGGHADHGEELLNALGLPKKREIGVVSGEVATSKWLEGRAIGVIGEWTVVWDPMLFVPDELDDLEGMFETSIWTSGVDAALCELSRTSRVYSFVVEGSSDTYGFVWYASGRRQRLWLSQMGSVAMADGVPLAEELAAATEEPDLELRMFVLMEKLTGISINDADAATYRVFA